ncbi:MAG: cation:proton antiporter [Kiritimatiellia bacterium]
MKKGLMIFAALFAVQLFAGNGENVALADRMMILAIQVGVILFAARFGNILFTKLKLPSVLGELCAGIAIGPYALGKMFDGWIFQEVVGSSVGVSPELYGLCTVASIVLLFLVGTETDLRMFMRYSAVGSLVGIGGVVVSFATGAWIGTEFLGLPWDSPGCIFLGVMSTATSVSITARILSDRRKLDSQEGVTILAGAVIDDVLGIIMLAIGMGMIAAQGSGTKVAWLDIGLIAGRSFGIWLGATVVGILTARWIARLLRLCGTHGEVATLTLGLALIVGGLFEQAHLAMIIGAYVMGLSFSHTEMNLMIQEKLHGVYQFLVPIFFAVMGMMVDVTQMMRPTVLFLGLAYTGVAILAKIIGCGLPTLLFGFNGLGALRVGLGMVPRGEVALIIAGIASSSGLLGDTAPEIFGVAVMMTLLTTLISPPLLVMAFHLPWSGIRKSYRKSDEGEVPTAVYNFPNHSVTNMVMTKILQNLSREGFFAHQINAAEGLYQARRADMVLNIICGELTISFSSSAVAAPFVRIIMAESLAEFEAILSALRKPIAESAHIALADTALAHPTTQRRAPASSKVAGLSRYISERNIITPLVATTREEIIRELLLRLHDNGSLNDIARAEEDVLRRENIMPTGVGFGVACPHARTDAVNALICAIGITQTPVDFSQEEEGRDCRIIILTLTPDTINSPYMTFITAMLTALRSPRKRAALLEAPDALAIRKALLSTP